MAILKFFKRADVKNLGSLGGVISYCVQKNKTKFEDANLVSGINCTPKTAMKDFIETKKLFGKEDGMQYYYAVQSFGEEMVDPYKAHQMAIELAERCYPNHQVLVATHTDTDNIHSHIIINSVNSLTGEKIHQGKKELYEYRKINDEICLKYGTEICKPKHPKVKLMSNGEYYSAMKGNSWKIQLCIDITDAMKKASSKEGFISIMKDKGYEIDWADNHKYVTYKLKRGDKYLKCRDNNLHDEKYLKEKMLNEFKIREEIQSGRIDEKATRDEQSRQGASKRSSFSSTSSNANGRKLEKPNLDNPSFDSNAGLPSKDTEAVSDQRASGELDRGKRESVSRLSSTDDRHSGRLHNRFGQDSRSSGEHEGADSISDGIENQGSYLTGWENERTVYLRGGDGERQSDTRSEAEFYNPLDTRHSSSNNSNRSNSQASHIAGTAFDAIAIIAEAFNSYDDDDQDDYAESGIDSKQRQKTREKKEAQGLRMGGM